ncbi:hypothetical protein KBC79_00075 [Candidatus Woesebacteria bacterium]|nr:hypothetical protein [Candidatus Woesebacteria bacterium]
MKEQNQQMTAEEAKETRVARLVRLFKDVPLFGPLYVKWLNWHFGNNNSMLAAIDLEARDDVLRDLVRAEEFFKRFFDATPEQMRHYALEAFGIEPLSDVDEDKTKLD